MKCEEVEARFTEYLDSSIDEGLKIEIDKHLETCEKCRDELEETGKILEMMSEEVLSKPDETLQINFYHMLHSSIKKDQKDYGQDTVSTGPGFYLSWQKIAAGFIILICGTLSGLLIRSGNINKQTAFELKQLNSEVSTLKKNAVFTMLNEELSSYRLQAVNFADELNTPDENVINILIKTLNNDKNVNVRLAAAYALSKYADQRSVCDSLIRSLTIQEDPIIQVTLINILVERKEKSALEPIRNIITSEKTIEEVKEVAEKGAMQLI